jgi:phenylacetate-CoA ligase
MRAFYAGLGFRTAAAGWRDDERRDWMLRRLRAVVRQAARESTFYRNRFAAAGLDPDAAFGFDDFARVPVFERADVLTAGPSLVSRTVRADQLRKNATGGSTGAPTEIWTGPEERGWRESGIEHYMRGIGLPAGSRIGLLWAHHLDPAKRDTAWERVHAWLFNLRWFDCLRLSPETLERHHRALESWRPQCVIAYASTLASLAERLRQRGLRPSYPSRCFVTGAEKLLPQQRELIEAVFRRPVHERYGSRDVGPIGFQHAPAASRDYALDWSNLLVEPETSEEQAGILVTKLHADGMPMVRYRLGDVGRFPRGIQPGHPAFVLHEVLGRDTDRVWLPRGGWVSGLGFPHLMKDYPVREFQVLQKPDFSVLIKVVPRAEFNEESRAGILRVLTSNLSGVPLDLAVVAEIPRTVANKWRPVISEVTVPAEIPHGA